MSTFGPLKDLVGTAGAVIAAGGAITLAWTRRAKWAPAEDDVPTAPAKVASLVASVLIAVMWFSSGDTLQLEHLTQITLWALGLCVAGLLVYVFLVSLYVYEQEFAVSARRTQKRNLIGGLWLTRTARRQRDSQEITVQTLLQGAGNDPDRVWPRPARALSKVLFIVSFISLQVFGSVALAGAALLVNIRS